MDLSSFKMPTQEKSKLCDTVWQEYAKKTCEEFNIKGVWKVMIFAKAKKNLVYLQGKVEFVKEKFVDVSDKGRYLIATFRTKK